MVIVESYCTMKLFESSKLLIDCQRHCVNVAKAKNILYFSEVDINIIAVMFK